MYKVSDNKFAEIVNDAFDALPKRHAEHLHNVAIIVENDPSPQQRIMLQLKGYQTLFGLYEGIPLNARMGQTKMLPDKITIFKNPLEQASVDEAMLRSRVGRTVWHEVAHYFGLNHTKIYELEAKEHNHD